MTYFVISLSKNGMCVILQYNAKYSLSVLLDGPHDFSTWHSPHNFHIVKSIIFTGKLIIIKLDFYLYVSSSVITCEELYRK